MRKRPRTAAARNQVRIIAGRWRGRKIAFADSEGLRPTPDRVRETLFNWLQFDIAGRRCLDLFAGSGALGIEAASRGAARVSMVEADAGTCDRLRSTIAALSADNLEVIHCEALAWLRNQGEVHYDIVFLDPPYHAGLLAEAIDLLEQRQCLSKNARIYLETDAGLPALDGLVPAHWERIKSSRAGQVVYALYERKA